jgi:hypothetical protein
MGDDDNSRSRDQAIATSNYSKLAQFEVVTRLQAAAKG